MGLRFELISLNSSISLFSSVIDPLSVAALITQLSWTGPSRYWAAGLHKLCSQHGLVVKSFGGPCESRGKGRARRKAKEEVPRGEKSKAREERGARSEAREQGRNTEGGARRGKESRGKGAARKNARERSEEQRGEKGATRSDLDSQNTCFYERDPCKTLV